MMPAKNIFRRKAYRWHRITSLIIALPLLLWTVSGFLHPIAGYFKPVVSQSIPPTTIDAGKIKTGLREALFINKIDRIHHFRIVQINNLFYYQVQQLKQDSLSYFSTLDGSCLTGGDQAYAANQAQRYLAQSAMPGPAAGHHQHLASVEGMSILSVNNEEDKKPLTRVKNVQFIRQYDSEYKKSSILLPVYRVEFDRKDHLRLYIETSTDRLSTAIDDHRALFNRFFSFAHSWSFLEGFGAMRSILLGLFSFLCFASAALGFYVYNLANRKKKIADSGRKAHRLLGNIFVLTTLLFAFSGAWHSFQKLDSKNVPSQPGMSRLTSEFETDSLEMIPGEFISLQGTGQKLAGVSVVRVNGVGYWQLSIASKKASMQKYLELKNGRELKNGELKYACYLASSFASKEQQSIKYCARLTSFTNQYSMKYKRLPVYEVCFGEGDHYFVETNTGTLSAVAGQSDKAERISFSNLHMHHYWEAWLGKSTGGYFRNVVLITSTLGVLFLAVTGLFLYGRKKAKKYSV